MPRVHIIKLLANSQQLLANSLLANDWKMKIFLQTALRFRYFFLWLYITAFALIYEQTEQI